MPDHDAPPTAHLEPVALTRVSLPATFSGKSKHEYAFVLFLPLEPTVYMYARTFNLKFTWLIPYSHVMSEVLSNRNFTF
jgi:hypothetical protein